MSRAINFLAAMLIFASAITAQDFSWYDANPNAERFYISTEAQLQGLSALVNRAENPVDFSGQTIVLTNNIILTENHTTIGNNVKQFRGIFDGNRHSILNARISNNGTYRGLFGYVGAGGQIKNVFVNIVELTGSATLNGGLAAHYASTEPIKNTGVQLQMPQSRLHTGVTNFGGLVGLATERLTIKNSFTTGNIGTQSASAVTIGGLVARSQAHFSINNSYSSVGVMAEESGIIIPNASSFVGGLIGHAPFNGASIENSYFSSTPSLQARSKNAAVGAIYGLWQLGTNTSVYYRNSSTIRSAGAGSYDGARPKGVTELTQEQLRIQSNFINWDFDKIWGINPAINNGFPYLRWFFVHCDACGKVNCEIEHELCDICENYDCEIDHKLCENPDCNKHDCATCKKCDKCKKWNENCEHINCKNPDCDKFDCTDCVLCNTCKEWNKNCKHEFCEFCEKPYCEIDHKLCEKETPCEKNYDCQCTAEASSIVNKDRNNNRYGIKFTQNPASENAEIIVVLPNNERAVETNIIIYDMTGNVVFVGATALGRPLTWDLRNQNGRFVANGTYLVITEAKDRSGKIYRYSARLGVNR